MCSDGYTPSLGSSCNKCSDNNSLGIALLGVFGVVAFVVCVAILNYMLSGQERGTDRGIVSRISRFIPLHSLKIIVVVWQILTQVGRALVLYIDQSIMHYRDDLRHENRKVVNRCEQLEADVIDAIFTKSLIELTAA